VPSTTLILSLSAPSYAAPGTNITYVLSLANTGSNAAQNVSFGDSIPSGVSFISQTQVSGPSLSLNYGSGTTYASIATLSAGASATVDIVGSISSGVPVNTTLTDQAGASTSTQLSTSSVTSVSATTTTTTQNQADLQVSQSAAATVNAGNNLTWTVTVTNNGPSAAQSVTLTDTLPSATSFVSQAQTSGSSFTLTHSGNAISDTLASLSSGASATFTFTGLIGASVAGGSVLSNTASAASSTADPNSGNNSATASTTVNTQADLAVANAGPAAVLAGNTITYAITVTNNGPSDAQSVALSDALPSGISFVSQSQTSGASFTLGHTGNQVSDTIATLPSGASATFSVVGQESASVASGTVLSDTAAVSSSTTDPTSGNNSATASATVGTQAGLVVVNAGPTTALADDDLTYTITVTNNGPSDAQNVTLVDTLPTGTTFVAQAETSGLSFALTQTGNQVSDSISTLPAGSSATFTLTALVGASVPDGTVLSDTATASTSTTDPNSSNNSSTASTTVHAQADLAVVNAGLSTALAGTEFTYTVAVTNNGPSDSQGVTLIDSLPDGIILFDQAQTSGPSFTVSALGGQVTAAIATLPSGASATFSIDVDIDATLTGGTALSATATVSSSTTDPNSSNNSATATTTVNPDPPTVDAGPSQTVHVGDTVTFDGSVTDPAGSSNLASIQWDFNYDGTNFNADSAANGNLTPTYSYSTPGTYLVALQATDFEGNSTLAVTSVVVKNAGALLVNAGPAQDVTPGNSVSFSGSYSDPSGTVSSSGIAWDFNYDGSTFIPDSSAAGTLTPTHTFSSPGTYVVALSVTDSNSVNDLGVLTVTVANYVGPTASPGSDQTVNEGATATFSGSYTDPDGTVSSSGIAWDFNYDGSFSADVTGTLTPSYQFLTAGAQEVALQVTDSNGMSSLNVLTMTVNPVDPTVNAGSNVTTTVGSPVQFSGSFTDVGGTAGASFAWDFNYDGSNFNPGAASTLTPVHTFTTAGTYTVALQVTDAQGNSGLGTLTVTVNSSSSAIVVDAGADQFVNDGDTVSFSGGYTLPSSAVTPVAVDWDFNYDGSNFIANSSASGTLTPSYQFTTPGTYLVAMRVTTANSLTGIGTLYVSVANPTLDVGAGSDQTANVGDTVSFSGSATDSAGSSDIASIRWDFDYDGNTFNADSAANGTLTPTYQYTAPGTYDVALQVTDAEGDTALDTLTVTVNDVAATATVTNNGPGLAGSPVTFTVSSLNVPDSNGGITYSAQWTAGAGFEMLTADELTTNADGSVSFSHVYDVPSGVSGYTATIEVADADGGYTEYTQTVVVADVAPTATGFVPDNSVLADGGLIRFEGVSDPSYADTQAGFTYYYSVNGGSYSSSTSSNFALPSYTSGLSYTVTAYIEDTYGGTSSVYTATVTTATGVTVVANHGSGTVDVNSVTVGANQYVVFTGEVSVSATLETSSASDDLQTNGSFQLVNADTGVTGVDLTVDTTTLNLSGLTAATGSALLPSPIAFFGTGDVGAVDLPGGVSTLAVYSRGDLGSIVGPSASGSSASTWEEATDLYFGNLTGSITGLDRIDTLVASGWLGTSQSQAVTVNSGIESLTAYGINSTVTGDANYDTSDPDETIAVGAGGVPGVVDMGKLASLTSGASVNEVAAQLGEGPVNVAGNINLAVFQAAGGPAAAAPPSIDATGDLLQLILPGGGVDVFDHIAAGGNINGIVVAGGSLVVLKTIRASGDIQAIGVLGAGNLTVTNGIFGSKIGGIIVGGDFSAKVVLGTSIDTIKVGGTAAVGNIAATGSLTFSGIIPTFLPGTINTISVGKDLKSSVRSLGSIGTITVGGKFTPGNGPMLVAASTTIGKITAGGDIGVPAAFVPAGAGGGRIEAGSIGEITSGNNILLSSIRSRNGNIRAVTAQGTIEASILAKGGDVLSVSGASIDGGITALASANFVVGGNIGTVTATTKITCAEIRAEKGITSITSDQATKVNVVLQNGGLKLTVGAAAARANYTGKVTFKYGRAPIGSRAKFNNNAALLTLVAKNLNGNGKWTVAGPAGNACAKDVELDGTKGNVTAVPDPTFTNTTGGVVTGWSIQEGS